MLEDELKICPITGLNITIEIEVLKEHWGPFAKYEIPVYKNGEKINKWIKMPTRAWDWEDGFDELNVWFKENKNFIAGLLLNNIWIEDKEVNMTIPKLQELVKSNYISNNPEDKMNRLFMHLYNLQEEDGGYVNIGVQVYKDILWKALYFKSMDELTFYFYSLDKEGLIICNKKGEEINFREGKGRITNKKIYSSDLIKLTYKGLNYAIKLNQEGEHSKNCFIAMAFKPETKYVKDAIMDVFKDEEINYTPIIMEDIHMDSDKTINDGILANIKKSKFCIADFTFNSYGVYFEAGYALGLGKKVIYTCEENFFKKEAHFDIKPLQHILYKDGDQLKKDLKNKIMAWID